MLRNGASNDLDAKLAENIAYVEKEAPAYGKPYLIQASMQGERWDSVPVFIQL